MGLHEFGHGLDANDGSGSSPDKGTGETYGDWTAALTTHDSCIGSGYLSSPCDGFGDACTSCTGVRDIDYAKHTSATAHTVANFTQQRCPAGGGYIGPCYQEGHCESYVSSEALWDLAARDMPNPGTESTWAIMDRLWYLSRPTATGAFTCYRTNPTWTSDGCGTGSLWKTMRAVDDDDGNLSNGTPHSAALYAAFNRHGIACTSDVSTSFRGCSQLAAPALTLAAANNQVTVSWSGSTGVYDIYRNEQGCNAGGFIKVANDVTTSPFTDSDVANDFVYYYKVVAQPSGNEACASAPSSCLEAAPCVPPAAPTSLTATLVGDNQIDLSWVDSPGATRYHVYRSTIPGGPYTRVGTQSGNTFSDTGLGCGIYYYVVRAAKNEACETGNSTQAAATIDGCSLSVSKNIIGACTVTSTPVGIACGADCAELYPYNTRVTLYAQPASWYVFSGWSGDCTGTTGICTVVMTKPRSVEAIFSPMLIVNWSSTFKARGTVTSIPTGINCGPFGGGTDCLESILLQHPGDTDTDASRGGHVHWLERGLHGDRNMHGDDGAGKLRESRFYAAWLFFKYEPSWPGKWHGDEFAEWDRLWNGLRRGNSLHHVGDADGDACCGLRIQRLERGMQRHGHMYAGDDTGTVRDRNRNIFGGNLHADGGSDRSRAGNGDKRSGWDQLWSGLL